MDCGCEDLRLVWNVMSNAACDEATIADEIQRFLIAISGVLDLKNHAHPHLLLDVLQQIIGS